MTATTEPNRKRPVGSRERRRSHNERKFLDHDFVQYADLFPLFRIPANKATINAWMDAGQFPSMISLGPNTSGWTYGQIRKHLEAKTVEAEQRMLALQKQDCQ